MLDWHSCQTCYPLEIIEIKILLLLLLLECGIRLYRFPVIAFSAEQHLSRKRRAFQEPCSNFHHETGRIIYSYKCYKNNFQILSVM